MENIGVQYNVEVEYGMDFLPWRLFNEMGLFMDAPGWTQNFCFDDVLVAFFFFQKQPSYQGISGNDHKQAKCAKSLRNHFYGL